MSDFVDRLLERTGATILSLEPRAVGLFERPPAGTSAPDPGTAPPDATRSNEAAPPTAHGAPLPLAAAPVLRVPLNDAVDPGPAVDGEPTPAFAQTAPLALRADEAAGAASPRGRGRPAPPRSSSVEAPRAGNAGRATLEPRPEPHAMPEGAAPVQARLPALDGSGPEARRDREVPRSGSDTAHAGELRLDTGPVRAAAARAPARAEGSMPPADSLPPGSRELIDLVRRLVRQVADGGDGVADASGSRRETAARREQAAGSAAAPLETTSSARRPAERAAESAARPPALEPHGTEVGRSLLRPRPEPDPLPPSRPAPPPGVRVTIGRVEVRAVGTAPSAPPPPRPARSDVMSLDEYLAGRARGERT